MAVVVTVMVVIVAIAVGEGPTLNSYCCCCYDDDATKKIKSSCCLRGNWSVKNCDNHFFFQSHFEIKPKENILCTKKRQRRDK